MENTNFNPQNNFNPGQTGGNFTNPNFQNGPQMNNPYGGFNGQYPPPPVPPRPAFQPKPKVYDKITMLDKIMLVVFFVGAFFINNAALGGGFKFGYTFTFMWILVSSLVYAFKSNEDSKFTPFTFTLTVLSIALSLIPTLFADGLINFLAVCADLFFYSAVLTQVTHTEHIKPISLGLWVEPFVTYLYRPFAYIGDFISSFRHNAKEEGKKASSTFWQIFIGVIISIPLLFVIVPILISSDVAFSSMMDKIFGSLTEILWKFVLAILLLPFLFSAVYSFAKKKSTNYPQNNEKAFSGGPLPYTITATVLACVSAFYLCYIFSQLLYFVSAFSGMLPTGYDNTPANYARQGFFEMSVIVVINLVIVGIALLISKMKDGKVALPVKITCSFVLFFAVFLIAASLSKMFLYINFFGLTRLRVLTSVFMIMLLVLIAGVFIHILNPKFPFMKVTVVICTVIGLAVGFADIDRVIASYNTNAYESGKLEELDVSSICKLGDSAVPYLIEIADGNDLQNSSKALRELNSRYAEYEDYEFSIKGYNFTELKTKKLLDNYFKNSVKYN